MKAFRSSLFLTAALALSFSAFAAQKNPTACLQGTDDESALEGVLKGSGKTLISAQQYNWRVNADGFWEDCATKTLPAEPQKLCPFVSRNDHQNHWGRVNATMCADRRKNIPVGIPGDIHVQNATGARQGFRALQCINGEWTVVPGQEVCN